MLRKLAKNQAESCWNAGSVLNSRSVSDSTLSIDTRLTNQCLKRISANTFMVHVSPGYFSTFYQFLVEHFTQSRLKNILVHFSTLCTFMIQSEHQILEQSFTFLFLELFCHHVLVNCLSIFLTIYKRNF